MALHEIEGIGPAYAQKLDAAGVTGIPHLLELGGTKAGRAALAERSGIEERHILTWVNHVDLMRLDGVGTEYADLLEDVGVDSVPELAGRNAENLAKAMAEANAKRTRVQRVPSATTVQKWVDEAKTLERAVHH